MAVPPRLHRALRAAMRATTAMVSPVLLELATEMIRSGAGLDAITFQIAAARQRQALAARMLGQENSAPTSMHFWLRLPPEIAQRRLRRRRARQRRRRHAGRRFHRSSPATIPAACASACAPSRTRRASKQALTTLARLLHADHGAAVPIV